MYYIAVKLTGRKCSVRKEKSMDAVDAAQVFVDWLGKVMEKSSLE
jgi:hypothetical protein